MKKRKGAIYDPNIPPPPLPFKNVPSDTKCKGCGNLAVTEVNLSDILTGYYCEKCCAEKLPYPYNERFK